MWVDGGGGERMNELYFTRGGGEREGGESELTLFYKGGGERERERERERINFILREEREREREREREFTRVERETE